MEETEDYKLKELIPFAMDSMGVAVTIVDMKGTILYYNKQAAVILDRKPDYIGKDAHSHHQASSNVKFDLMLDAFRQGRVEPFYYEARPYGKTIQVTLSPILKDGSFIGCVQCVTTSPEPRS